MSNRVNSCAKTALLFLSFFTESAWSFIIFTLPSLLCFPKVFSLVRQEKACCFHLACRGLTKTVSDFFFFNFSRLQSSSASKKCCRTKIIISFHFHTYFFQHIMNPTSVNLAQEESPSLLGFLQTRFSNCRVSCRQSLKESSAWQQDRKAMWNKMCPAALVDGNISLKLKYFVRGVKAHCFFFLIKK